MSEPAVLMAVHAHPDDECISTGGTLARYASEGVRTVLVTCTNGDVGEISDPSLASPENLAEVRARELAESVRILNVSASYKLGYRDSGMAGTADNQNPACFHVADLEEATERLVRIVRQEKPQVILTYDAFGGYGHPDHIKSHQVAVAAFHAAGDPARFPNAGPAWQPERLYYTAFPRKAVQEFARSLKELGIEAPWSAPAGGDAAERTAEFGTPDELVTTAIDVSGFVDQKRAALAAHATQMGPENFFMRLPMDIVRKLWVTEFFERVEGESTAAAGERENDLFSRPL